MAWPLIAVSIGLSLISSGVTYYRLRKTQEDADQPNKFDPGSVPIVSESAPIPVVFGTVRLRAPNIVWSHTSDRTAVSGRIYVHMLPVWCHGPVDRVGGVYLDDHLLSVRDGDELTHSWDLIGGPVALEDVADWRQARYSLEGGGSGGFQPPRWSRSGDVHLEYLDLRPGLPDQGGFPRFAGMPGWPLHSPNYRSVFSTPLTFELREGVSRLPMLSIEVSRWHATSFGEAQWQPALAKIGDDMNPAHIIREAITDEQWGLGRPDTDIDEPSFIAAAQTLHSEGLGLSLVVHDRQGGRELIDEICRHIDGMCFPDPQTGKIVLRLVRDDFDVAQLPEIGPDMLIGRPRYSRPSPSELVNEITVEFSSRTVDRTRSLKVDDLAMQIARGPVSQQITYPGIYDSDAAAKVATRDLLALSQPLRTVEFSLPAEEALSMRPGDVVLFSWPEWGIKETALRIAQVTTSEATSSAARVVAIQDAFAFGDTVIAPPDPEDPGVIDEDPWVPAQEAFELPLWLAYQRQKEVELYTSIDQLLGSEEGQGAMLAATSQDSAIDWTLTANEKRQEGGLDFATPIYLTPQGPEGVGYNVSLANYIIRNAVTDDYVDHPPYAETDTEAWLLYLPGVEDALGSRPQFAMAIQLSQPGLFRVSWGWLDTAPPYDLQEEHLKGYIVGYTPDYLAGEFGGDLTITDRFYGVTARPEPPSTEIDLSALPRTASGELPQSVADVSMIELDRRAFRPYPPGPVSVAEVMDNKDDWGVEVSFLQRFRGGRQAGHLEIDVPPPPGVNIRVSMDIYIAEDGAPTSLLGQITDRPFDEPIWYPLAAEMIGNNGRLADQLIFELRTARAGLGSLYATSYIYERNFLTFSTAGATGRIGPSQAQVDAAYAGTPLDGAVTVVGSGDQVWEVPNTGRYLIQAAGASGGYAGSASSGGRGAIVTGVFLFEAGQELRISIGQQGESSGGMASGGGGTLVGRYVISSLLRGLVAGGGGGHVVGSDGDRYSHADAAAIAEGKDAWSSRTAGAGEGGTPGRGGQGADSRVGGGGGSISNGEPSQGGGGYSFSNGAMGGEGPVVGGFGGGGAIYQTTALTGAGGGGGYSGGGGSYSGSGRSSAGGGGGSIVTSAIGTPVFLTGDDGNVGDGWVKILYLGP